MSLRIDHVLFAVPDLDEASEHLTRHYGLASLEGGQHPSWGTANRIVPLGDSYLELVTVVSPRSVESAFGRWVTAATAPLGPGVAPMGWAVRTDELAAVCERLGLSAASGERRTPEGGRLTWSLAGVDEAASGAARPFFVSWGSGTPLPGTTRIEHPRGDTALASVTVGGDIEDIRSWLGPEADELPLEFDPGASGTTGIALTTGGRRWRLGT